MSVYVGFKIGKARERKAYISEYYCGACGWPVSDHDSYCPECGGAFRAEDATERTCRNASGSDDVFKCSECGAEFEPLAVEGNEYGEMFYTPFKPLYCSVCGAEVVE